MRISPVTKGSDDALIVNLGLLTKRRATKKNEARGSPALIYSELLEVVSFLLRDPLTKKRKWKHICLLSVLLVAAHCVLSAEEPSLWPIQLRRDK
jgi:hypothetical protein